MRVSPSLSSSKRVLVVRSFSLFYTKEKTSFRVSQKILILIQLNPNLCVLDWFRGYNVRFTSNTFPFVCEGRIRERSAVQFRDWVLFFFVIPRLMSTIFICMCVYFRLLHLCRARFSLVNLSVMVDAVLLRASSRQIERILRPLVLGTLFRASNFRTRVARGNER